MNNERIEKALSYAWSYGQIDGSHHKMWVIDQMVRALLGEEEYKEWVKNYETPTCNEDYYVWNIGITP